MNRYRLSACAVMAAFALFASLALTRAQTQTAMTDPSSQPAAPAFSNEELDQLVAPIALYSDTLLAQVFMASTYPLEVVEADRWVREHSSLKGGALTDAAEKERWDASVKALVQVPQVLKMMSDKLDWTQKLGDAFLAQQKQVMDAVQRLRRMADKAGNLKSGEQHTVIREPAPAPSAGSTTVVESAPSETIIIQEASPEVVYVPDYNPQVAYGTWPYPSYPPYYWGAGYWAGYGYPYAPLGGALAWGAAVGITAGIWNNAFDWGGGDININNSFNRNTNWNGGDRNRVNHRGGDKWRHDSSHRRGVNYRDNATRDRFAKGDKRFSDQRRDFRGRDGVGGRDGIGGRDGARGQTPRLSDRDMNRGNDRGRDNRAGRDRGRDQAGRDNRGGRDQLGQRDNRGKRDQLGANNRSRDQFGQRNNSRSQFDRNGRGGPDFSSQRAANRSQYGGGGRSRDFGGGGYSRGGSRGGFDGIGRGGSTRSFSSRGGGSRGGSRGGGGRRR